jgi:thymidylate synthase
MNNIDRQYKELSYHILNFGIDKADRTGTGTKSIFGWQIRHNMKEGFPLLTTKKMAWKSIVTELLWFLRGDTNIKFLVDNGCNIWNGDAYKNYCKWYNSQDEAEKVYEGAVLPTQEEFINRIKTDDEFAKKWGELGPIYGKQWRSWGDGGYSEWVNSDGSGGHRTFFADKIDQIANLINELKTNPDSRRLMVSAWNVGELDQMVLPPCHYGFQVYTRELGLYERIDIRRKETKDGTVDYDNRNHNYLDHFNVPKRAISLMFNMRSVDTFLGLPFNIASYGLLLEIIAKEVNMVPEDLIGNLGDVHLYNNHIEQAEEQLSRTPYELPKLKINFDVVHKDWECLPPYDASDFTLENYQSHPAIKAPLSN